VARFQLVEREKVQAVCRELNLTAAGLTSKESVARLGQVMACDWLVSGSFVQANRRTHVWTKVIDIRSGVVLDLKALPYDPADLTNTVSQIAAFLAQAGSPTAGRQFIAMGPFVDMNSPLAPSTGSGQAPKREDWSRRFAAAIERHFLREGIGVVELAAITPIFEERRLETGGLTGAAGERVKLQPAFWPAEAARRPKRSFWPRAARNWPPAARRFR